MESEVFEDDVLLIFVAKSHWKQHIHTRQNQQVRGLQSGGIRVLTPFPRARRRLLLRAEF